MIAIKVSSDNRIHIFKYELDQEFDSTPDFGATHYKVLKSQSLSNAYLHTFGKPYLGLLLDGYTILCDHLLLPNKHDLDELRRVRNQGVPNYLLDFYSKTTEMIVIEHTVGPAFRTISLQTAKNKLAQSKLNKLYEKMQPVLKFNNGFYLANQHSSCDGFLYERRTFKNAGFDLKITRVDQYLVKFEYTYMGNK